MAALPAGWIDTGEIIDHNGIFDIDVAAVNPNGFSQNEFAELAGIYLGLDISGGAVSCPPWNSAGTVSLYVRRSADAYAARTVIDTASGACPQPRLTCPVTVAMTDLRLGFTLRYVTATGLYHAEYALFADSGSTVAVTVGGLTTTTSYGTPTQVTAGVEVHLLILFASSFMSLADGVKLTGVQWNGEADPGGDQSFDLRANSVLVGATYGAPDLYPPLKYVADVRVEDAGGSVPALTVRVGDTLGTGYDTLVTNGNSATVNYWRWRDVADESTINARIDGGYTEDGIATSEAFAPLRRLRPKRPSHAPEDWSPLEYVIASPVSVLLSTNNWTKTGSIALSGSGNSTWTVTGAGTVSRALAATYSSADGYTTTKHGAGEDVFGWSLYSYLALNLTANVSATLTVTLNYVTDNALGTTTARTYTIAVTATTATYRLDLLFPNEGGPDYWERVASITIDGFANGTYTLNSAELVAVEDAYVKAHSRKTAATDTQSGLVIAQDGSFGAYFWGENVVLSGSIRKKDDETGHDGTGTPTTNGGCFRMNTTISALATEMSRMEGLTATYDGTGITADLTDADGNVCGFVDGVATPLTYAATWLHTVMRERAAAGATKTLYASLPIDDLTLCPLPAAALVLPYRTTLGMMLEALCVDGSGDRAAADFPMVARRSATGTPDPADPVIGSGVTDASGFVQVPIPTGLVGASQFYTYLSAG